MPHIASSQLIAGVERQAKRIHCGQVERARSVQAGLVEPEAQIRIAAGISKVSEPDDNETDERDDIGDRIAGRRAGRGTLT